MESWDKEVDLLVMGSGAAGMSAAVRGHDLGMDVLLLESSDQYGGSTAMSGGVCWVPNNRHMQARGIEDNEADALEYLLAITKGQIERERLEIYIKESQRMLNYLEDNTHVAFDALEKYTDYYPESPGARNGARSMECYPFDGAKLGEDFKALRRPHPQSQILGKFGITARQAHVFLGSKFQTILSMIILMIGYLFRSGKRKKYGRDTRLCAGNSLIGRLRLSLKDRNVPLWLNSPAKELIIEDGKVTGAIVEHEGKSMRIRARKGVVIAAGGFSRNHEMRQKYQRHPIETEWTAGNPADLGAGVQMGIDAGAALDLMKEAWWTPTCRIPGQSLASVLVVEKSLPYSCFVNQKGERFTNESAPYIDVVIGMYEDQEKSNAAIPAWMIFDARCRHNYPIGPVAPGYTTKDAQLPRRIRENFLYKADTLEELATKLNIEPATLRKTVDRFNANADKGIDPDFGRGESEQDKYYGDPKVKPNPCLGAIEKGPFYAIEIYPGDLGTKGGMVTDNHARVLREDGSIIEGLYAAGNSSASIMGETYPGAGGTIAPALTFGMLAAEAAAEA